MCRYSLSLAPSAHLGRWLVTRLLLIFSMAGVATAAEEPSVMIDSGMMAELMALHGLDEPGVIERLIREQDAAEMQFAIEQLDLPEYVGSWFDPASGRLHVAITDQAKVPQIERLGAVAVPVAHGIGELNQLAASVKSLLARDPGLKDHIVGHSINIPENRVDVYVETKMADAARLHVNAQAAYPHLVEIVALDGFPVITTGDVRGADGTRNFTWQQIYGGTWPCSIGASIVGGYITAGHCGTPGNVMHTPSGELLGTFKASQWGSGGDGGWVETASGWIPSPKINGYADGILSVPAKWAGLLEAPIGATICRYGQTSGGPDCGTVAAKDVTIDFVLSAFTTVRVYGLTETNGICTDDGDSGGPYITPSGQVQGTNTGGEPGNTCPVPANRTFFQPVNDTLSAYSKTLLTVHGAAPPVAYGASCPDPANSGGGMYACKIISYDSQGQTTLAWTSNAGHSSTSTWLFGSCSIGTWVTVDLVLQNPYGTQDLDWMFLCPGGQLP